MVYKLVVPKTMDAGHLRENTMVKVQFVKEQKKPCFDEYSRDRMKLLGNDAYIYHNSYS